MFNKEAIVGSNKQGQSERAVLLHLKEMRERSATKRAHTSNPYTSIYAFNLDKNIKINF